MSSPTFTVISGAQVQRVLDGHSEQVMELIEDTYRTHGAGGTINPPSYFLSFPDRPSARIIALPASVSGKTTTDGIKWISSFPENIQSGLPRASAVLILNDQRTGYPLACLESSIISATRTAASAALAADVLSREFGRPTRVGFVGAGLIARYVYTYLDAIGWYFESIDVYDLSSRHAAAFSSYLAGSGTNAQVTVRDRAEDLIRHCDLIVFATVAGAPHVHEPSWFDHCPLVLHVSLRDLSPEIILTSTNVVDDVEHCLKANTSVHLTEQREGNRKFLAGTLYDVLNDDLRIPQDRPVVFSPFGLGALDIALGRHVYDEVHRRSEAHTVSDFFFELDRYGQR